MSSNCRPLPTHSARWGSRLLFEIPFCKYAEKVENDKKLPHENLFICFKTEEKEETIP